MKIIFFGSSEFAVASLEALSKEKGILLLVTQPDRKKGRSLKLSPPATKLSAKKLGIKVYQPVDVNSKDSLEYIKNFQPDLFVVVSFGQILSKGLLEVPRIYPVNLHASLLPKYRGAAPINWALANGERETGLSVIKMNEKMDEGDIISQKRISIDESDDGISLSKKLSRAGSLLLLDSVRLIESGTANFTPQDHSKATFARLLKKEDGHIDWSMSSIEINNRVRAFMPWPGCSVYWNKKILKIWKGAAGEDLDQMAKRPGAVLKIDREGILVSTGDGIFKIEELQLEGKRRMKVEEFMAGHHDLVPGTIFS